MNDEVGFQFGGRSGDAGEFPFGGIVASLHGRSLDPAPRVAQHNNALRIAHGQRQIFAED